MRILIVEDEPMVARRLRRLIGETCPRPIQHLQTVHTLPAAQDALADPSADPPIDLLFLDLNLNGQDGFQTLEAVATRAFHTVIVSAHTDQAIRAFDVGVFDFIRKPFDANRLRTTFARLFDTARRAAPGAAYLLVRKGGAVERVPVRSLLRIEGAGSYAKLVLRDGSTALHTKSLKRLVDLLPPVFERIHRSHVVRLDAVNALEAHEGSRYSVQLHSGETLPVGRTRVEGLRERLQQKA